MQFFSVAFLLLAFAQPATEADKDPSNCEMVGEWENIEGRNPTSFYLTQDQKDFDDKDSVLVLFSNDDWSIAKGQQLGRVKVTSSDGGWFDNQAIATDHGFALWSEFKLISNVFDDSPRAMVLTRNGKTVDKLSLTTILSEWSEFKRCRAKKSGCAGREEAEGSTPA